MLEITSGVLFHQVNCHGVMGAGIAAALAAKFPGLEPDYQKLCKRHAYAEDELLGKVLAYRVNADLYIANAFGQGGVSRSNRQTNYEAVVEAFERVKRALDRQETQIFNRKLYFPYKMGCGLGGGDWTIYSAIIEAHFPNAIICRHEP